MKKVNISKGNEIIVDDEDFEFIRRITWKMHSGGYVQISKFNLLHRIITDAPTGMDVHHINGNKLDNRKENLLLLSPLDHQRLHSDRLVKFQRQHQKYPNKKTCCVCGDGFIVNPRKRKRNKCCSAKCAMSLRIAGRKRQAESFLKSRKK